MMKFDFKPSNDDDVVETVKFTRKELRAIATMASYYADRTDPVLRPRSCPDAAKRLVAAIDKRNCGDWSNLFLENH